MVRGGLIIPKGSTLEEQKAFRFLNERINESDREIANVREATDALSKPDDKTPPHPVRALRAVKYETHIRLEWQNPANADLRSINITKTVDGQPVSETFIVAAPTNFVDDFDTIATSDYVYEFVTYDQAGNKSSAVTIEVEKETIPAPDAILINGDEWTGDDLEISWDAVDGFGVSGYRVDVFNGVTRLRQETVTDTNYIYTLAKNTADGLFYEVEIRVYTLDASGNLSVSPAEKKIVHVPPSTPLAVTASLCDLGFKLNWTLVTEPGILGYVVALDGEPLEENHTTGEYLYKTLLKKGDYLFSVASKNKLNQLSEWAVENFAVLGPGEPSSLVADDIDNTVTLTWAKPDRIELPIAEYEIRKGADFETSVLIGRKQGTFTTVKENTSGTFTYWVAAVDTAENIGVGKSAVATVDGPSDYVLNVNWECFFNEGNATNILLLEDGSAIAPYTVGLTWEDKFIGNGTKANPQFRSYQDLSDAGYEHFCQPVVALTARYSVERDYEAVLPSATISSDIVKAEYGGGVRIATMLAAKEKQSDTYTDQTADRIFKINLQYVRVRFEFTSDGFGFSILHNHFLRLDSKLKSDAGKVVIGDSGESGAITFNKDFVDIVSITLQPWGDGNEVLTAVLDFDDEPRHPKFFSIHLFNSTGVKTSGKVSWEARGY